MVDNFLIQFDVPVGDDEGNVWPDYQSKYFYGTENEVVDYFEKVLAGFERKGELVPKFHIYCGEMIFGYPESARQKGRSNHVAGIRTITECGLASGAREILPTTKILLDGFELNPVVTLGIVASDDLVTASMPRYGLNLEQWDFPTVDAGPTSSFMAFGPHGYTATFTPPSTQHMLFMRLGQDQTPASVLTMKLREDASHATAKPPAKDYAKEVAFMKSFLVDKLGYDQTKLAEFLVKALPVEENECMVRCEMTGRTVKIGLLTRDLEFFENKKLLAFGDLRPGDSREGLRAWCRGTKGLDTFGNHLTMVYDAK